MLRHLIAISLAVLLCWPGTGAAQAVDAGAIRVGDRWSYDIKDGLTGDLRQAITTVVVDINDREITTQTNIGAKIADKLWSSTSTGVE